VPSRNQPRLGSRKKWTNAYVARALDPSDRHWEPVSTSHPDPYFPPIFLQTISISTSVQVLDGREASSSVSPRVSMQSPLRMPRSREQLLPGAAPAFLRSLTKNRFSNHATCAPPPHSHTRTPQNAVRQQLLPAFTLRVRACDRPSLIICNILSMYHPPAAR
jgi:hypothetical protein